MVNIDALVPGPSSGLSDDALRDHYSAGVGSDWMRVNFVASVDGASTVDGKSGGLGGDADLRVFTLLRTLCDVVLVASGTVKKEGYGALVLEEDGVAARVSRGLAPQPVFAIVSGTMSLDPESDVFTRAPVRPIVLTASSAKPNPRLEQVADVIVCGSDTVDAVRMRAELIARGLRQIHCEGGPSFFGSLLAADVVDELCLTVSPLLVGGDSGRIAHGVVPGARRLDLAGVLRSQSTLLLRYLRSAQ
jgi:riboflavin biosynthesis pyrimidine reductase